MLLLRSLWDRNLQDEFICLGTHQPIDKVFVANRTVEFYDPETMIALQCIRYISESDQRRYFCLLEAPW